MYNRSRTLRKTVRHRCLRLGATTDGPTEVGGLVKFGVLGSLWSLAVPLLVFVSDRLASRAAIAPNYRWPATVRLGRGRTQADE